MDTTDVREAARSAVNQSKSLIGRVVDERTRQLGEQIGTTARDLRTIGDDLRRSSTLSPFAEYADRGAEAVDRLGNYLSATSAERLIGDLENLARRQPWAFAAGALALGFAGSRFLKTSSARRYRTALDAGGASGASEAGDGAAYGSTASYGTLPTYGGSVNLGSGGRYAT
jgi:hypothetical protein